MIASLGMYIRAQTQAATDRYWGEIRDRLRDQGIDAPDGLLVDAPELETWTSPELAFSQTCGRPFRLKLHGRVNLVGTPDYGLEGCAPGYYRSPFVVRADDPRNGLIEFRDSVFAFNEELSQSGWAAPRTHVAGLGFQFQNITQSGGHVASAKMVAEGHADIAALDGLTWQLIQRYDEFAQQLRVIEWTTPTPGLPYICALGVDAEVVFAATQGAIDALSEADREVLCLKGLVSIPASDYLAVPNP